MVTECISKQIAHFTLHIHVAGHLDVWRTMCAPNRAK